MIKLFFIQGKNIARTESLQSWITSHFTTNVVPNIVRKNIWPTCKEIIRYPQKFIIKGQKQHIRHGTQQYNIPIQSFTTVKSEQS